MSARKLLGALALVALVQACASVPVPQRESLALIDIPEPTRLTIHTLGHPDATDNLTQQLFFNQKMAGNALELEHALQPEAFHAGKALDDALSDMLARTGWTIVHTGDPQKDRTELLADYSRLRSEAAVDLDVVPISVGYWNTFPDGPWRPWVIIAYRLRDHRSGSVRASGQLGMGPAINGEPIAAVAPEDRFSFANFDALVADPSRAARGLREAIRQVADALAQRL